MASVLNSKAKTHQRTLEEYEAPSSFVNSAAEQYIKLLAKKQTDTNLTLEKQLNQEKVFHSVFVDDPTDDFSGSGLSRKDSDNCARVNKTIEEPDVTNCTKGSNFVSRHIRELAASLKQNAAESHLLELAISSNSVGNPWINSLPSDHPVNQLAKIHDERFAHLAKNGGDIGQIARKMLKKRKRMLQSLEENIGPKCMPKQRKHNNSLWDVLELNDGTTSKGKVYSCPSERLFTIKDGKIVEIDKQTNLPLKDEVKSANLSDTSRRLTEEEIKNIPKFANYDKGTPSKILFVKNLSPLVCEADLIAVFSKYQKPENPLIEYSTVMKKGRLRGQAFVNFSDMEAAKDALEGANGIMLYNKPMIIHFGKKG